MDEKKLAEEAAKQAKAQKLGPEATQEYIRDYTKEAMRIERRFYSESDKLGLNETEQEIFRSLLTTTSNYKADGTLKSEDELWQEVIGKMETMVKSRTPEEKPQKEEAKEEPKEAPEDQPKGDYRGKQRIDVTDDNEPTEEDYPLADDDNYFEWRKESYRKLKTLKQAQYSNK